MRSESTFYSSDDSNVSIYLPQDLGVSPVWEKLCTVTAGIMIQMHWQAHSWQVQLVLCNS